MIENGMFGNHDQFTLRHNGGGHVGYLDGSTRFFKPPDGRGPMVEFIPGGDLEANYIFVSVKPKKWFGGTMDEVPYGWINDPRLPY